MPFEAGDCSGPRFAHWLPFSLVSLEGGVNKVEDSLLHLEEGNETHAFVAQRLHSVIEFEHKHFVDRGRCTVAAEVAVESTESSLRVRNYVQNLR